MLVGRFHQGSGLGNQLHRYVMTRVLALDKGFKFGMESPELFKGASFMNLDMGEKVDPMETLDFRYFFEKKIVDQGNVDIRGYDPEINFVEDWTCIEGEFQDEKYWAHREKEVDEWLKVEPLEMPEDVCVIGFRGGEYKIFPELFLPKEYWLEGVYQMLNINPAMKFEVHTDDPETAQKFFPSFKIIENQTIGHSTNTNAGYNWRAMRYAKYAIIANSSFYILPRWLRNGVTIAPRYWARRNTGVWALPQNYYSRFKYI